MNLKRILDLLTIVGIMVVAWIGYGTYTSATKSALPNFRVEIAEAIDPTLDLELLENLSTKIAYQ